MLKLIALFVFASAIVDAHNIFIVGYDASKSFLQTITSNLIPDFQPTQQTVETNTLPYAENKNDAKKMIFQSGAVLRDVMLFDFLYHYPCDVDIMNSFRTYQNSFANGDKVKIIEGFVNKQELTIKHNIIVNAVSHLYGCNIDDIIGCDDNQPNTLASIFSCKLNGDRMCYISRVISPYDTNSMIGEHDFILTGIYYTYGGGSGMQTGVRKIRYNTFGSF